MPPTNSKGGVKMLSVNIQKELWQEWLKADINQMIKHHKKNEKGDNISLCNAYHAYGSYNGLDTALSLLVENGEIKPIKNLLLSEIENILNKYVVGGKLLPKYIEGLKALDIEKTVSDVFKYYDSL